MRFNEPQRRKLRRFFCVSGSFLLLAFTGLCCWIKANEQELLRQARQAKASGCPCKKIELNHQPQGDTP
ncbi:MAG: hypothetical protein ACTFAL_00175 [Candidatus Electronema sp. V4]|uniref:hypothetical protein n=1 Tax=Candidatus Electronema sp. V4 TaxID=3454756 RepID=UPI004055781A